MPEDIRGRVQVSRLEAIGEVTVAELMTWLQLAIREAGMHAEADDASLHNYHIYTLPYFEWAQKFQKDLFDIAAVIASKKEEEKRS